MIELVNVMFKICIYLKQTNKQINPGWIIRKQITSVFVRNMLVYSFLLQTSIEQAWSVWAYRIASLDVVQSSSQTLCPQLQLPHPLAGAEAALDVGDQAEEKPRV